MNYYCLIVVASLSLWTIAAGWKVPFRNIIGANRRVAIPSPLQGSTQSWDVRLRFNGEDKVVNVSEDQVLLEAAESVFTDPPYGCRQGACYACTAQVISGQESIVQDSNLLGPKTLERGIICTCQAHVTGPGVVVQLGAYDSSESFDD